MARQVVTDHALVRYLERVVGIDLTGYRREIETATAHAIEVGASGLIHDGFRYVIAEGRVITVESRTEDPPVWRFRQTRPDDEDDGGVGDVE